MMRRLVFSALLAAVWLPMNSSIAAPAPVAWWSLDDAAGQVVHDRAGGIDDAIAGNFTKVDGAQGGALRFDGYAGETATLEHTQNPAKERDDLPEAPTIQRYNLKSAQKPFICFEPGNKMGYLKDRGLKRLEGPGSCNHWPVGQAICDGRTSQAADRPTSFLGFPISTPPVHDDGQRERWFGFYGMTEGNMEALVRLGRSWAHAAPLTLDGDGWTGGDYDRGQRAYILRRSSGGGAMSCKLAASPESPVINPAFVVKDWDGGEVTVEVDGRAVASGPDCRIGRRAHLDGADLIIWLKLDTEQPISLRLVPGS